jgi:hypothetical protein
MTRTRSPQLQTRCKTVPEKEFLADRKPGKHDPINQLRVSEHLTFRVRKLNPSMALNWVRFLLTKVLMTRSFDLCEEEAVLLHESWRVLVNVRDNSWNEKYNQSLTTLEGVYSFFRKGSWVNPEHHEWWNYQLSLPIFRSKHAYFGWVKSNSAKAWLVKTNRQLRKSSRPKRFIGVGYRDHGTAKKPHWDGTPSWQEVAGSLSVRRTNAHVIQQTPQEFRRARYL